ncbi:asparagine synthase-related protein [Paenibacillus sacheonensis]|uniref:asparagine synthase (glutamine-hydrolyzing) n=1 Tax=Paenibacillus sacheonensis TaxID=742054 RepID=A0A7X4YRB1_9BACL|nr:asparagine synthase-related protein [Paenibacillus sacheonensis]MBM7563599.1 asparagine synthase (glutamine-hydrolyzing) [Paenibacillus sacheonensis]NBC71105.1 asparagine synthetase B [Paenibacillus sacheonensis]
MSAIAGMLRFDGQPAEGAGMMKAMEGYDADDVRTWTDGPVFLGCLSKWITPESVHERLPSYDAERRLAIASDAMLDNRGELFALLQVEPARRSGMTDSELILLAYRKWGRGAPEYLIGDFAFVIWDEANRQLFGARDLFGHRCLYYCRDDRRFAFGTTMAPLFALPGGAKELNESWLAEFMAIPEMYESTDAGATPYRNIHQVPPAHAFVVSDGRLSLFGYGSLEPKEMLRLKSDGEYEEAFRDVFGEAVKSRIRTHRQVAATLSGGLDSGAVASFAARALREEGKKLHTYSYVPTGDFTDWTPASATADESRFMKATALHAGNISDRYMDFKDVTPMSQVDEWLDILETPYKFFENSFWLKGMHEQAGRQGAGVLLTGARGNFTVSWGPAIYYYAELLRKMKWLQFMREFRQYKANKGIAGSRLLSIICKEAFPVLAKRSTAAADNGPDIPTMLIHPDFAKRTDVFAKLRDSGIGTALIRDPLEVRKEKLQSLAVANKNGASATKLSLRYGAWERDPTCDPRVVRFCFSVPLEQYVGGGLDRALIRRSTKHYLPDEVRLNQRVRGIQGADWVHRVIPVWKPLEHELLQLCADPAAGRYLHVGRIKEAVAQLGGEPRPEHAFRPELRMLMRSLIIYRFLKRLP